MSISYIGIDPGLKGAVAIMDIDGEVDVYDCPIYKEKSGKRNITKFDIEEMATIIRCNVVDQKVVCCVEKAQAMPSQGVSSMFKTGKGLGIWEGILAALNVQYKLVSSRVWQKDIIGEPNTIRDKRQIKADSIRRAGELYPSVVLTPPRCRVPKDGRADAINIMEYCKRLYQRGEIECYQKMQKRF